MFDERAALKLRLEQMRDAEERLMAVLQRERGAILARLRELDERDSEEENGGQHSKKRYLESASSYLEAPDYGQGEGHSVRTRKGRPSRRSKTTKMRDTAISVLKEQDGPMRGADLQREIEDSTGFRIANMTTFMKTIEKADENIVKVGRGLYIYQEALPQVTDAILLGTEE